MILFYLPFKKLYVTFLVTFSPYLNDVIRNLLHDNIGLSFSFLCYGVSNKLNHIVYRWFEKDLLVSEVQDKLLPASEKGLDLVVKVCDAYEVRIQT